MINQCFILLQDHNIIGSTNMHGSVGKDQGPTEACVRLGVRGGEEKRGWREGGWVGVLGGGEGGLLVC